MNPNLFRTTPGALVPAADTTNNAGGVAYSRSPEEALAQFAATGCFGSTFYVKDEDQLADTLKLAAACSPEWVAKCAVYARERGLMKDMPAILCAYLAKSDVAMLRRVFHRCIDNGKMLRNFVQAVRSGVTGRKSFGTAVKRLIREWFDARTNEQLFHASIGEKPSLGDIIKMVHPKPKDEARRLMYAYIMGKPVVALGMLPEVVQQLEGSRLGACEPPDVNFQLLTSMSLTPAQWARICDKASWTTLRMNLNTFARHGCFNDSGRVARVIARLTDPDEIRRAKPMPYQLFSAYLYADENVPQGITMALAQAADLALANVPTLPPNVFVGVDVSSSMQSAITGARGSATSKMRCIDVAALIGCAILRKNPTAKLIPFDTSVHRGRLLGASVLDMARTLATFGGGGTRCALPVHEAVVSPTPVDAVVIVSDNESWIGDGASRSTETMTAWRALQQRSPNAKLVCIDLTPNKSRQVVDERNVLSVGGFSDAVFDVIAAFLSSNKTWTENIAASVDLSKTTR